MAIIKAHDGTSDPIVTRLVAEDHMPWYKKPNLRLMYVWLFLCCMGVEMTSGFDSQLINTLQFSQPFNKYFGAGYTDEDGDWAIEPSLLGFISSSYQLGSIFAVPIAPWFNNRFGRRWSIMTGSIIMCIGAIIQGFSQHVAMYIIARIILGIGILFAIISGSSLIGELGHPKERAVLTSLFNSSYFVGSILAAAISIGTVNIVGDWSWRVPSLLQLCPSVLQICTIFLLPESPRWLVSKDRDDEAFAVLTKYHAEGDTNSLIVQAEMAQIKSTIKLEMEVSRQSWMTMINTSGMRRRVLIATFLGLFTQMSGNTLLSYYTNLIFGMMGFTSSYAKTRINIANQCWSLLNGTIIAIYVTRFRRRVAFMTSSLCMLSCFIAMTVAFHSLSVADDAGYENKSASYAALVFYFAYSPTYAIGNNALTYTYLVELFPYAVRSRGIGIEQIFGKCGGFFSNFVNPIAMDAIGWKYFAAYCAWIFFEFCFQFIFYPETGGRTLEELAFLFEDKELADRAVEAVEKQIHHEDNPAARVVSTEEHHPRSKEV
ncbi:major myo-inositol transporter iolT [Pseudomassariella vexata]|uniref:Major myo-inositol transporter iolT n=1 Tax=Pseudomassariella vexata TaxID=1141098 RepID=A0A1Y2DW26_9PEZI|nr:major myo-inositol transporter iolT [Pseudomassariella vexata]ORY63314.1 major myo-inositol transporter iolT [Pseudomassariella vexata]